MDNIIHFNSNREMEGRRRNVLFLHYMLGHVGHSGHLQQLSVWV